MIIGGLWFALEDKLCANRDAELLLKRPMLGGCFEFWWNRYQTLTAAVIAAGVALFVVRPVILQLREMNKQSSAQLRLMAESRARALEEEIDVTVDFNRLIARGRRSVEAFDEENWHDIYLHWPDNIRDCFRNMRAISGAMRKSAIRYASSRGHAAARRRFMAAIERAALALDRLDDSFASQTSGLDPEFAVDFTPDENRQIRAEIDPALSELEEAYAVYAQAASAAVEKMWQRAQAFEDAAYRT